MDESPNICPYLPNADPGMDWRSLNRFGKRRDVEFYEVALRYAQDLWLRGLAARALLSVDRALYADLQGDEPILKRWPLPYAAVPWMVMSTPDGTFIGNPRVHYQHLADRVKGDRQAQKKWRAWACWALVRKCSPDLPPDPKHRVVEPSHEAIRNGLTDFGIPDEVEMWESAFSLSS
ncbi:hypothetical protein [Rubellicoccus peritrichatus]|uniref:Uncharacterized protein n=1 Tax=Rubellicoccus peritrichatus TaxID=3080537 RepID=A0AAQ3LDQ8_9BACT|nr:hypothetical protein [Puniceicoccus sp. CR14]WOO42549.1 hypothetical protein RZN69_05560 [Puniceicoccus sp. CR14]